MSSEKLRVPNWIRKFTYEGWTNVLHLAPYTEYVYPVAMRADWQTQFNDWGGRILLLAKDGCSPDVISERIEEGESHPWRYGEPPEKGSLTNTRLFRFASMIPGGKLYGSATANMLYDGPGMSRKLEGFKEDSVQDFLREVLCWVLESMPHVEWVACLGNEAWFLTCNTLGDALAANQFQRYRESYRSISGIVGEKKICAFPLYHPAARGDAINDMESGWRSFAKLLSAQSNVNGDPLPPELLSPTKGMTRLWTKRRGFLVNPVRRKAKRIVDATLPKRACRVQFIVEGQVVHTSKRYDSCNTCENIIKEALIKVDKRWSFSYRSFQQSFLRVVVDVY